MAKQTIPHSIFFLIIIFSIFHSSNQLQISQFQALLRIQRQLNLPQELTLWKENQDFCNSEPSQFLSLACYDENITQLHITGNYWVPHLTQDLSVSSLFSNIANLPNLKVLSLTSLGLRGKLPPKIASLSSLEILNMSCNSLDGVIPREISFLKSLQTLILDHNSFQGGIPGWIGHLPVLSVLSLKNNSFSGSMPKSMSKMVNLRTLVLSGNNLSGEVVNLHRLRNLQVLDLGKNGFGPLFPRIPTKVGSLILRKNKFRGGLPDELSSCYNLQVMDISLNEFVGPFSSSILALPSLTYLDIGGNKFTGKMTHNVTCNGQLRFVNLSQNRLTGDLPDCLKSSYGKSRGVFVLYSGNCFSRVYRNQHPSAFCHTEALAVGITPVKREKRRYGGAVLASGMVGGIVGVVALVGLAFVFVKKKKKKESNRKLSRAPSVRLVVDTVSSAYTLQLLKDARYISETMKMGALGFPTYRTYVLDELKEATNNFNETSLIGEGSYGQVYKGWLTDGSVVAIRSLKAKRKYAVQTYTHQLELIARLRHCHLVSAIGHCFECHQDDSSVNRIFLVFEYVPNGTLRSFVSDGQPGLKFTWTQRIAAGIGVARGIQFLHTGIVPGVYTNHLKITDVLLDNDLHVKIKKYNLPLLTENRKSGGVENLPSQSKGKFGSMLHCEEKHDIYDFGVILLEMIVGRMIVHPNDVNISKDILSVSLAADNKARRSIVDPAVHKECSDESVKTLIELCVRCLSNEAHERPSVEDVIWNLQFAAQVQDMVNNESSSNQDSPAYNQTV